MPDIPAPTPSGLFNEDGASLYLGVQPQTLASWRSSGRYGLRYTKIGRLVRYRRADLDAFIESRTIAHTGSVAVTNRSSVRRTQQR